MDEQELKEKYPLFCEVISKQIRPAAISYSYHGIELLFTDGRKAKEYYTFEIALIEQGLKMIKE